MYILGIKFICDQVEAVLNILEKQDKNKSIDEIDWKNLYSSKGYKWLITF